tara:strand:+ start:6943 stop:7140 length:198 start_codon:yes stop_codon:yes gene_type:complete
LGGVAVAGLTFLGSDLLDQSPLLGKLCLVVGEVLGPLDFLGVEEIGGALFGFPSNELLPVWWTRS